MIHFLGDFYIDELPDIKLSKNEIILFSYLALKKSLFLNEVLDLLSCDGRYDISYLRKLLKSLAEKLQSYVKIKTLSHSKVDMEVYLPLDVELLLNEINSFEEGITSIVESSEKILELYKGHFLPFVDNLWVDSYRNLLKSLVFSIFSKVYVNISTPLSVKLKLLNVLPELYSSVINTEILNALSQSTDITIGESVFEIDSSITPVIIKPKDVEILRRLILHSKSISFINNIEIIALVDSELLKKMIV